MAAATESFTDQAIEVAGLKVRVMQGGRGSPVVVLHHSTGGPGWIPLFERLSAQHTVVAPDMPGYGQSERPEWAREPRDLAILMNAAIDRLGLTGVTLVGLGFGGFVAAEMATMNPSRLKALVLVGAPGLQPEEGEIADQMMVDYEDYVKAGFRDEAAYTAVFGETAAQDIKTLWDFSREMTARLTWKPYMFNRRLAPLLKEVRTPTLIVWGEKDAVVPPACGRQYKRALPNARLEVVAGAGHLVELEEADRVAKLIAAHAAQA
ncbi:MAG: alpha/beta hydrolase [Chloroflexi bacterium]|nr:alpha/beta hydrolase [Chloroflexota bacterium]